MITKKKEKGNSLKLALYFGILVIFIITVSLFFKAFDLARKSKFDGKNRFTVAVISDNESDLISVSPQDGSLTRLDVKGATGETFNKLSFPVDAFIKTKSALDLNPKTYFLKTVFHSRDVQTNLTFIDLLRLGIFSNGVNSDKIDNQTSSVNDAKLSDFGSTLFTDPAISDEKVTIQITNSTNVPGLGNRLAKYITNLGGDVVLVNTSSDTKDKSEVLFKEDSYTVKKISKILNVTARKSDGVSISDIIIIIGNDRSDLLN